MKENRQKNVLKSIKTLKSAESRYIVLPLMESGDLHDLLSSNGVLNESEACKIIYQILSGWNHIHNRGIVHGALKPENILYKSKSDSKIKAKIGDFGDAMQLDLGVKISGLENPTNI